MAKTTIKILNNINYMYREGLHQAYMIEKYLWKIINMIDTIKKLET